MMEVPFSAAVTMVVSGAGTWLSKIINFLVQCALHAHFYKATLYWTFEISIAPQGLVFIKMPSKTASCYYHLNGVKGIFSDFSGTSSLPVLMHVFKTDSVCCHGVKWKWTQYFQENGLFASDS